VRTSIAAAGHRLADVSQTPRLDAELLMAHALGVEREAMLLHRQQDEAPASFQALVERRLAHEPVAYITGRRAFWTIDLEVGPGVLIPRPDSETLIEAALAAFGEAAPATLLDLGTGPGTLLLAALAQWPAAHGVGVDCSPDALAFARRNAERLEMSDRASLLEGDWSAALDGRFDLILCNPPYVEEGAELPKEIALWEPAQALYAGPDGLDACRRLAPRLPRLLSPGGVACVEIGAGQAAAAAEIFAAHGFTVATRQDLGGIPRCLILTLDQG
jgi:release factor glutamine methyltransferase